MKMARDDLQPIILSRDARQKSMQLNTTGTTNTTAVQTIVSFTRAAIEDIPTSHVHRPTGTFTSSPLQDRDDVRGGYRSLSSVKQPLSSWKGVFYGFNWKTCDILKYHSLPMVIAEQSIRPPTAMTSTTTSPLVLAPSAARDILFPLSSSPILTSISSPSQSSIGIDYMTLLDELETRDEYD
ncbi:hypothetical protein NP233_g2109 [Leucocoprinus birnbaumii]|uniref:Uncharacterized protein n=1 Tax=Leucocoprinus birnbaumii TaxID=56174 RepID=A0AAD5YU50_9AGAR|nr:hypothetical protein NP233_g2109 [Leucocoprinus birnbaumii]